MNFITESFKIAYTVVCNGFGIILGLMTLVLISACISLIIKLVEILYIKLFKRNRGVE